MNTHYGPPLNSEYTPLSATADTYTGTKAEETYVIDHAEDKVDISEASFGKGDTVYSFLSYTVPYHISRMIIWTPYTPLAYLYINTTLTGTGNDQGNYIKLLGVWYGGILKGMGGNDTLIGDAKNDIINGGSGADIMDGRQGNDTYYVDNSGDNVVEYWTSTEGNYNLPKNENYNSFKDLVYSSINYILPYGVEDLILVNFKPGEMNEIDLNPININQINGTGNELSNTIIGNGADNILSGKESNDTLNGEAGNDTLDGGVGNDTLRGGAGSDTYYVDHSSDVVEEFTFSGALRIDSGGIDTIISTVNFMLSDYVENLILSGVSQINGIGNSGNNVLTGNDTNNTLDGRQGADNMRGGAGNDTYIVDNVNDTISELVNEGIDSVHSSVTYTLSNFIENLILTGSDKIDGTGNYLNNIITGNNNNNLLSGAAGDDTLDGGAGDDIVSGDAGADTMRGGAGNDTLRGGADNDIYYIDDYSDIVEEFTYSGTSRIDSGGIDTIISTINFTLSDYIENLILSGKSQINGTGNSGNNVLTGNDANNTLDGGQGVDTMRGGAGSDSYYVDNSSDVVDESTSSGTSTADSGGIDTIYSTVSFTLPDFIENLTLLDTSQINGTGSSGNNVLTGNSADNTLDGRQGVDTMIGCAGNDKYIVDNAGDTISELTDGGTDSIESSVTYTLSDFVENLTLTGSNKINGNGNPLNNIIKGNNNDNSLSGSSGDDTLDGGAGNDTLTGGSGNDTLDGGVGVDKLRGGVGDDTYHVDNSYDVVEEFTFSGKSKTDSGGDDTIIATITFTLPDYVENLTLSAASQINGTGNSRDNVLTGNNANNTLDGAQGVDIMKGGAGNDTYIIDNTKDTIVELDNEGVDYVHSSVNFTLINNVENLRLTGVSPSVGYGNNLDNYIYGNIAMNHLFGGSGNDTLDGEAGNDIIYGDSGNDILIGGVGNDTLRGGIGDDTYYVDNSYDIVEEFTSVGAVRADTGGNDTIVSAVSFTLSDYVENLTLSGVNYINGTGNSGDNVLTGNDAHNTLDGRQGADTMIGGAGNDTYIVDNANDIISEFVNKGTDSIESSVTYTLSDFVENLKLTGSNKINGIGNSENNTIIGNGENNILSGSDGNDVLSGGAGNDGLDGGSGNDIMRGGSGNDTYSVDTLSDIVEESNNGTDLGGSDIVFSSVNFTLPDYVEDLTLTGWMSLTGTGNALNNRINANDAGSTLFGLGGNDTLVSGTGDDILHGGAGNDLFSSGSGSDRLLGGEGNDTYWVHGDKATAIEEFGQGVDTVMSTINYALGANIENLHLYGIAGLSGIGNDSNNIISAMNASPGASDLFNQLDGAGGDDTLIGSSGNDYLRGGEGNDSLQGGLGADVYEFGIGSGADSILEPSSGGGSIDTLAFDAGINPENLWFARRGSSLEISIVGLPDATLIKDVVTVKFWYLGGDGYKLDKLITAAGKTLTTGSVDALVSAMAGFAPPVGGLPKLSSLAKAEISNVIAMSWAG